MPQDKLCTNMEDLTYSNFIYINGDLKMKTTTIFKNGPSTQAVRIPMEYRLLTKEAWVEKVHNGLLITPKADSWNDFFLSTPKVSEDFSTERNQQKPQTRDDLS